MAILSSVLCVGMTDQVQAAQEDPVRIVCLGDSITDGNTYPQIVMQAFRDAGVKGPVCICSGAGGNTAQQMDERFDTTVAIFKPDLVTVSAATNDVLQGIPTEAYAKAMRSIVAKAKAIGAKVMLLTPCENQGQQNGHTEAENAAFHEKIEKNLDSYEAAVRQIAAENSCVIAEDRQLMQESLKAGNTLFVEDHIHPNYLGQSLIARSIIDALGHKDVALPKNFDPKPYPGLVEKWKVRLAPVDEKGHAIPLIDASVAKLSPDDSWKSLELPQSKPAAASPEIWPEQARRNGFAMKLEELVGKGDLGQGYAEITSANGGPAFIQLGMQVQGVWLNGTKVHEPTKVWTGGHAGEQRVPVTLQKGVNRIVIEFKSAFYLAVTPELIWEDQLR